MNQPKPAWQRFLSEGFMIVVSVVVGISIQTEWQDHEDRQNAEQSLSRLLQELNTDETFLEEVKIAQSEIRPSHSFILAWLENPNERSLDSLNAILKTYDTPKSMWPSDAAWTTMVASGQLKWIKDKSLVSRLGDYYEHWQTRVEYNSNIYQQVFERLHFEVVPQIKNMDATNVQNISSREYRAFRNQVLRVQVWTDWYVDEHLLNYESALLEVIKEVEGYL